MCALNRVKTMQYMFTVATANYTVYKQFLDAPGPFLRRAYCALQDLGGISGPSQ